ncbi:uncharacterized protein YfkK (UPF0435 family) [Melghiribacillus thermohalophilus]|uniref:Uncharacterized protein YfkK (UPF0435 family) n=1 Tax=Melghiribacillus thermohalophilus TaxID=1324956 RepID=A0A4R3NCU6_9BACI|nr:DUF1128 domain-containing protein [Melghiribacillus thermohalophilus]TCT26803.1 uncharacterized protein YfkK (UPF0435 family) [Melghiribacillus thermohalophilus]
MDLQEATEKNLAFMIEKMADKLQIINRSLLKPEDFDIQAYQDIKNIYEMIHSKPTISVSEIHAIIDELSKFRK